MTSKSSYAQILKASSIMGGAAGINLLLSMVRVKFAAVFIGTTGVGLISSFGALQGLIGTLAGLGLQSSAVREIAAAVGKGDDQAVGRAVLALRRLCWLTGLVGMAAMVLLSPLLSQLTFGHRNYTFDIAALGVIILFGNLSGGQMAHIQGMRRIGDMARADIYGAAAGTVAAIGFYAALGLRGIIPTLVAVSAIQLALSFHFARRVPVPRVSLTWRQTVSEASGMVRLGLVMMWSGLMGSAVAYLTVTLITQHESTQAVGLYSAAFAMSALFVNFVLQAMGADYYPRLSAESGNDQNINRLANEQIQIGILLATPGLIATIVYAEIVVKLFYTNEFVGAVALLQIFVFGCFGRVVGWPTGFIILAKKKDSWFFFTQTLYAVLNVAFVYFALQYYGLIGTAIAFGAQVVIGIAVNRIIIGRLTKFEWNKETIKNAGACFFVLLVSFFIANMQTVTALALGTTLLLLSGLYTARQLAHKLGPNHRINKYIGKSALLSRLF